MPTKSILVVHEDLHVARLLSKMIESQHWECHLASSFSDVEAIMDEKNLDVILTDINISGVSRNEYVSYLKTQKNHTHVIVASSMDQESMKIQSIKLGAKQFINLPVSVKELQDTLTPFVV